MTALHWWLVILGAGLGTYALRAAPFLSERLNRIGQENMRFLTDVSLAIAAGIVSRSIVLAGDSIAAPSDIAIKIAAVLGAYAVYRLVRNLPTALFGGVGLAVLLKWLTL